MKTDLTRDQLIAILERIHQEATSGRNRVGAMEIISSLSNADERSITDPVHLDRDHLLALCYSGNVMIAELRRALKQSMRECHWCKSDELCPTCKKGQAALGGAS